MEAEPEKSLGSPSGESFMVSNPEVLQERLCYRFFTTIYTIDLPKTTLLVLVKSL